MIQRSSSFARAIFAAIIAICSTVLAGGDPRGEDFDEASRDEREITARDRQHWSYAALRDVTPPPVRDRSATRTVIDHFVLARLEQEGIEAMPPADRFTLIRRVTFDLTGLPPTPDEIREFASDGSADAYERLVDRLLASPSYGQRWGQHWLDLARFAETDGFEHDKLRPEAWRYRDWVIDALNGNMPYDEFVQLQLAGDRLYPDDPAAAIATGFALCGPDMPDINSQRERRHTVLNEMTAVIGAVFLGLRMECAQCHDHKSDPISQADFYRLRAFFDAVSIFRDHPIATAEERQKVDGPTRSTPRVPHGRVLREGPRRKASYLAVGGDYRSRGPRVRPALPRVVDDAASRGESRGVGDADLRPALARWISAPRNPLALRVAVNRVWQHFFAHGLVRTPSDFGLLGDTPSHPLLLDFLASELPRVGWSLKRLQRLIVVSAAYRRASRSRLEARNTIDPWQHARTRDPQNRLLSRQNRKRLEAETIRDAVLSVAGCLSSRRGGRGVMPPLPQEIRKSIRKDHWKVTPDPEDHHRRSIYLFVRRNLRYPFFEVFDRPDTISSCARRNETTIAPQSLAMLNSDMTVDAARHFAGRAIEFTGDDPDLRVDFLWVSAFGRPATTAERRFAGEFLESLSRQLASEGRTPDELPTPLLPSRPGQHRPADQGARGAPSAAALTSLCLALLNANEFIYVD